MTDWESVATLVPGRTGSQCRYRWLSDRDKQSSKMPWSTKEDDVLKKILAQDSEKPWAVVAQKFNEASKSVVRTGKQCRERWRNHLDPTLKKYY